MNYLEQQTADGTQTLQLDAGMNHVSFPIRIAKPKLWYPVGYGAQNRYRFSAAIRTGQRSRSAVRGQNRTAFGRTAPRSGSMGKEF